MVEAVGELLSIHGVGGTPAGGCPFTSIRLSSAGDRIRVEIVDPSGRKSDRTVTSAKSAATVIESWLQEDPTALFPRTAGDADDDAPSAVASPPPAPAPTPTPVSAGSMFPAAPSGPIPRAYFDLDGSAGAGFDGSGWFGGGLSGCAALGPVCLGAGAAIGVDPPVGGDSEALGTQRLLLDVVALLDCPVRFRGFTLRPGIDLGAAFARVSKPMPNGDEEDEDEDEGQSGDGNGTWYVQGWEFALGAHVIGAIALGNGFALTVGAAVVVLPAADTGAFVREEASLAGVPRGLFRGTVGLEYAL